MGRVTDRAFFTRPAETLAPALLGKIICRRYREEGKPDFIIKCRITETEAYPDGDEACDGAESQKLEGGHLYVTKKGMHGWCRFDIVANEAEIAEGVLIRGVDCYDGPGKAAEALAMELDLDGVDLLTSDVLWIEDDGTKVEAAPPAERVIGEGRDAETKRKPYRFAAKGFLFSLMMVMVLLFGLALSGCGGVNFEKVAESVYDEVNSKYTRVDFGKTYLKLSSSEAPEYDNYWSGNELKDNEDERDTFVSMRDLSTLLVFEAINEKLGLSDKISDAIYNLTGSDGYRTYDEKGLTITIGYSYKSGVYAKYEK